MVTAWYMKSMQEFSTGKDITIEKNTTLNEKFNILSDRLSVPTGIFPKISYFGLGIGGTGTPIKMGYHSTIDSAMFDQIPLIARKLDNDLTLQERARYRFRVERLINGTVYVFYYLQKLEENPDLINIKTINKIGETNTSVVDMFDTNDPSILNPVASIINPDNTEKSRFYIVENNISFSFTLEDKNEIINAYRLSYTAADIPNITEISLFTGLDTVQPDGTTEAYVVRGAIHYATPYELQPFLSEEEVTHRYIGIGGMRLY